MKKAWERIDAIIGFEIDQRHEEGCIVDEALMARIASARQQNHEQLLHLLMEELASLKPASSFPYREPDELAAIKAARPDGPRRCKLDHDVDILNRIHGGWLGRTAGCALGKPVEKWSMQMINEYLEYYDALPLDNYIPAGKGFPKDHDSQYFIRGDDCTRGNITHMPRDDDMDYTVLGLHTLEHYGYEFTSVDAGFTWIDRLPYNLLYTAERIAYCNLINDLNPPASAEKENPFREWIGAQIRADIWGYVTPGWPEKAAEFAYRDATISHTKNGVYGAMFFAAILAASFSTGDVKQLISIGLSEIPENCRLADAIRDTMHWSESYDDWQQTWSRINEKYGHYSTVHTINNAALVIMGLLYGQGDFEKTIVTTVLGGWDADCTGATAGSVIGLILGADALPEKWVGVFNDQLKSAVRGSQDCRISDLTQRTHQIALDILKSHQSQSIKSENEINS